MRNIILLGCVLFASACDVVAPEDATTVRIVSVTTPATRTAAVLMRIQNIGPAGTYYVRGYEYNGTSSSDNNRVYVKDICSRLPTAIEANTTINTELVGCGAHTLDWIVMYTTNDGGTQWTRTACYAMGSASCPSDLARER